MIELCVGTRSSGELERASSPDKVSLVRLSIVQKLVLYFNNLLSTRGDADLIISCSLSKVSCYVLYASLVIHSKRSISKSS